MKWISVDERLPEIAYLIESILVTDGFEVLEARYTRDGFSLPRGGNISDRITHWMPLPDAPGGE